MKIETDMLPKRVLLKLSGETLLDKHSFGIDHDACLKVARYLQKIQQLGVELGVVIGGGNIFRGVDLNEIGIARAPADYMGMLATLINGTALQQTLLGLGSKACLMSALECPKVAESYTWTKALSYLQDGNVVIFVGGTGNPYFTTDTAAALRASEIQANILLKATKVDGVYNKDPLKFPDAVKYDKISYSQFLAEKLKVMDATSVALCRSNQIPIFVFNMQRLLEDNLKNLLSDLSQGTLVEGN